MTLIWCVVTDLQDMITLIENSYQKFFILYIIFYSAFPKRLSFAFFMNKTTRV